MFPKTKQDFLNSFTENTILSLVIALRQEELEKKEEQRRLKAIEQEKLKMKFAEYQESKINNIPSQQKFKQPPIIKTIELKTTEIKPEIKIQETQTIQAQQPTPQQVQQTQQPPVQKTQPASQPIEQPIKQPIQNQQNTPKKQENIVKIAIPQNQPQLQQNEINFGKILFLIRDPQISYIECPGENQNIMIKKAGHTLKTQITLSKEEMISIINSFSEKTRIPLIEGLLSAKYENLEISAIVSNIISPSFMIRKELQILNQNPNQQFRVRR